MTLETMSFPSVYSLIGTSTYNHCNCPFPNVDLSLSYQNNNKMNRMGSKRLERAIEGYKDLVTCLPFCRNDVFTYLCLLTFDLSLLTYVYSRFVVFVPWVKLVSNSRVLCL